MLGSLRLSRYSRSVMRLSAARSVRRVLPMPTLATAGSHALVSPISCRALYASRLSMASVLSARRAVDVVPPWVLQERWEAKARDLLDEESSDDRRRKLVLWGICLINAAVFLLWVTLPDHTFMFKHFTVSWNNLRELRLHTLVTACFSHADPVHILFNTMALMAVGPPLLQATTPTKFLLFYIVTGIFGSLAHIIWQQSRAAYITRNVRQQSVRAFVRKQLDTPALGASGSITALLVSVARVYPNLPLMVYFIPMNARLVAIGLVCYDLFRMLQFDDDRVSHAGHIGGAVGSYVMHRQLFGVRSLLLLKGDCSCKDNQACELAFHLDGSGPAGGRHSLHEHRCEGLQEQNFLSLVK